MDPYVLVLSVVFLVMAWLQLANMSFMYNFVAAYIGTIVFIYFAVVARLLFPIEQLLFYYLYKGTTKLPPHKVTNVSSIKENFDDEITRKMRELTGHIVRDFILEWYNTVSDDVNFVQEMFELFDHVFASLRYRISAVNKDILLASVLNFLSRHHHCFDQSLLYARANSRDPQRLGQLMISNYEKQLGHLAMSDLPNSEMNHLRGLVTVLLKALLPQNYQLTGTSLYLVRELISRNVFLSLIDMLSDPDWINGMVVHILKDDDEVEMEDETTAESSGDSSDTEDLTKETDYKLLNSQQSCTEQNPSDAALSGNFPTLVDNSVTFSMASNVNELSLNIPCREELNVIGDNPNNFTAFDSCNTLKDYKTTDSSLQSTSLDLNVGICQSSEALSNDSLPSAIISSPADSAATSSPSSSCASDIPAVVTVNPDSKRYSQLMRMLWDGVMKKIADRSKRSSSQEDRFFRHIRIPDAMTTEEAFEGGNKYTLYKIEYCAPPLPAKRGLKTSFTKQLSPAEPLEDSQLQHFQVQRRFREFLTLQDRLNEKPIMRRLIRDVKAPSRMFMPIGNMDKDYIEKRRKFLQAYLRELCSFPHVCHSAEMKEFFAYNSDPRIAFVRRPSDYIPRFDKMLKSALQDLLGSASDKIVGTFSRDTETSVLNTSEEHFDLKSSKSMPVIRGQPSDDVIAEPQTESPPISSTMSLMRNPVTRLKNIVLGKPSQALLFEEGQRDFTQFVGPRNSNDITFGRKWLSPDDLLNHRSHHPARSRRRIQGDGCDGGTDVQNESVHVGQQDLITGRVFRLAKQIWNLRLGTNTGIYLALGRYVKYYVDLKVASFTEKVKWLQYLKNLQDALWPGGTWSGKTSDRATSRQEMKKEARIILEETFPDALRFLIGNKRYEKGVEDLLDSFQNKVINRHLAYHLIDVLTRLVFPDLHAVISRSTNVAL